MKAMYDPRYNLPYQVTLNPAEWPPVTWEDKWVERPIYKWVKQNCGAHLFSPGGWVMFLREADLVQFQLTWSQP